jgi:hypothetical protein
MHTVKPMPTTVIAVPVVLLLQCREFLERPALAPAAVRSLLETLPPGLEEVRPARAGSFVSHDQLLQDTDYEVAVSAEHPVEHGLVTGSHEPLDPLGGAASIDLLVAPEVHVEQMVELSVSDIILDELRPVGAEVRKVGTGSKKEGPETRTKKRLRC